LRIFVVICADVLRGNDEYDDIESGAMVIAPE
jgi:hypothetical protein